VEAADAGSAQTHAETAVGAERRVEYSANELSALYDRLGPPAEAEPFPMYGVPRAQVLDLIVRHGGTVAHVEDDGYGAEWVGYRYFVTK